MNKKIQTFKEIEEMKNSLILEAKKNAELIRKSDKIKKMNGRRPAYYDVGDKGGINSKKKSKLLIIR